MRVLLKPQNKPKLHLKSHKASAETNRVPFSLTLPRLPVWLVILRRVRMNPFHQWNKGTEIFRRHLQTCETSWTLAYTPWINPSVRQLADSVLWATEIGQVRYSPAVHHRRWRPFESRGEQVGTLGLGIFFVLFFCSNCRQLKKNKIIKPVLRARFLGHAWRKPQALVAFPVQLSSMEEGQNPSLLIARKRLR